MISSCFLTYIVLVEGLSIFLSFANLECDSSEK